MQYIMAEVQANRYSRLPNKSTGHLLENEQIPPYMHLFGTSIRLLIFSKTSFSSILLLFSKEIFHLYFYSELVLYSEV